MVAVNDSAALKRYRTELKNQEPRINYKQINKFSIADIAMTEYICFSKTIALTIGTSKIKAMLIDDKFYKFQDNLHENE